MKFRVGQGVDVHPFAEDRPLILGGVQISARGGLAGHSDADAVLHAVVDAILGAIGKGDIGEYFPSSDARWAGADSKIFMAEAIRLVEEKGGAIENVDITIIAEAPRMAPHRAAMRESVARMLGIATEGVNVKATTTDHLGFLGRGEGICVLAVALVQLGPLL